MAAVQPGALALGPDVTNKQTTTVVHTASSSGQGSVLKTGPSFVHVHIILKEHNIDNKSYMQVKQMYCKI
jgi:hypothetical protein